MRRVSRPSICADFGGVAAALCRLDRPVVVRLADAFAVVLIEEQVPVALVRPLVVDHR